MPTIFNSVGSSDSETMAITKLVIAGAHLSPAMKLKLKRMIEMAKGMTVAPPEAVVSLVEQKGGKTVYALKKRVCVLQEPVSRS